ncbi:MULTISPECIES: TRAP transporter small permease [Stenotrophomonas]|jgi:TRAP-type C4-dicarboxylate transport system permease small subunit|uniref:TRAP transporter small permease protein n=1 Tax=Stenotrophomonas acidaminiphila TaxID=128780 RepID=A0A0S1AUN8_9GAMM|nr:MULTISPECIES: TRAP transporter small permease [Stenotrophomonas]OZB52001.1 MAG: TRAP transporter small permease protein [Stenotrophomonas sp. 14-69-23]ALJ26499.1 C4-dicarboxylate membrane transport protein [Stenotrophomonas acidaminiphila]MCA7023898.1 TRAP transporter small permease [Stenotrophomonas acidaminiphila]MCE4076691.1 TRAP transporter small permease [Stenotrophomonas acidaminiphila]WHL18910.1 TRAP transporter small permease [Stenotrophomonas acidaminiphila]
MTEATSRSTQAGPQRALETLATVVIHVAVVALLGLVVVQGWQVFARYVINDSPSWTEPVTLLLLSTAMSMGAAAGVHTHRHFGFFLLADHLNPLVRRVVDALVPLVVAAIGAVIAWWGWVLWIDGLHIKTAGANLPQSVNYLPLSLGGALMVVFALNRLWLALQPAAIEGDR